MQPCLFCGGIYADPAHLERCDGRQGRVEALYGSQGDVPYEAGSETSQAAAASVTPDLGRLEAIVFACIKARPRTCDEVEAVTGLSHQTVSARIRGLVLRAALEDTGQRAITRSGRRAAIWQARG